SSKPTTSAPAALASSALAPCANTATRLVLPVPLGSTTAPRTTWSDLRASTPSCTATSIDSSNLAVAQSFTSDKALSSVYSLVLSILPSNCFCRLLSLAMSHPLHDDAHRAGRARDGANRRLQVGRRQILHLGLGDLLDLLTAELAHALRVRTRRALVELRR